MFRKSHVRSFNPRLMLCVLDTEIFSQLSNIVRVIDMDGFTINKKFYCMELGILNVGVICQKRIGRRVGT